MSTRLGIVFGSGDSRLFSGLTPTFVIFVTEGGTAMTAPPIVEIGSGTGLYYFTYEPSPTFTIFFQADGGSSVVDGRWIKGSLDPIVAVDQKIGFAQDSYGSTVGATSIFGLAKRINELWQADATFSKTTGTWNQFAKGTSTLLFSKILTNTTGSVTKG